MVCVWRVESEAMKKVSEIAKALVPKWEPCGSCVEGWRPSDRHKRGYARCWCWTYHQQKIAALVKDRGAK